MNPEPRPFDMDTVVSEVEKRLAAYDDLIEVSVLGSAGRGIGEARHADFGSPEPRTRASCTPRASR
jgi:4-hydroxy-3-methylbut-2-en-1-yl diphosphate synthase IspG/GcpE